MLSNFMEIIIALNHEKVIAYPTEAVFGLGCDPFSETAVKKLLKLKNRTWEKGLILVAMDYSQLINYIDESAISNNSMIEMFNSWPGHVTWLVPAKNNTPFWLTGISNSLAIRISAYEPVRRLCFKFGKPLISTSANITGKVPAKTVDEVRNQFGKNLPLLNQKIEGKNQPSIIKDILTGKIIRNII